MITTEQIEAKALELHENREANAARRMGKSFLPTPFKGVEREFCLSNAKNELEQAHYRRQMAQSIIDSMAHLSNEDLRRLIGSIERRRSQSLYFLATSSGDVQHDRDRLFRLQSELERREAALDRHLAAAE